MNLRIALCAAPFLIASSFAIAQETVRHISVTGQGSLVMAPDMATITLGVQNNAQTARAAMRANSAALGKVVDGVQSLGVAEKDIQTTGLSLSPVYERRNNSSQPPRLTGFSASNMVTVRVRDLAQLGGLLDRVVELGATNCRGLHFDISERSDALNEARRAAVADAMARAQLYADAAGVDLGEVISINESGVSPIRSQRLAVEALAMDAVPISPGELTISANIGLTIALN